MALSKAQKAARAQKNLDEARALLAVAEAEGAAAGLDIVTGGPAIGAETMKNTSTVWIGLKLPRGLSIQLHEERIMDRPTFGGGMKPTKVFMRTGEPVRLKGYAVPHGKVPNFTIIGDFGLTQVDRKFWETWKEQNAGFDLLQKGIIFAHGEKASVEAYAEEHADLKCGLEPLQQKDDPRTKADQPNSPNLTEIAADTDRPSKAA